MEQQEVRDWLRYGLPREEPRLHREYLDYFGLKEIPTPVRDNATGSIVVWQHDLTTDGHGNITGRKWNPSRYSSTRDGLVTALQKRWLLAPPEQYPGLQPVVDIKGAPKSERGAGEAPEDNQPVKRRRRRQRDNGESQ